MLGKSEKISIFIAVLFLLGTASFMIYTEPAITGYVPATYAVKDLEVVVIKNASYTFASKEAEAIQLTGVLISGKVVGPGEARAYLNDGTKKYLIYSNDQDTGLGAITGYAIKEDIPEIEFTPEQDFLPDFKEEENMYGEEYQTFLDLLQKEVESNVKKEVLDYIDSVDGVTFNKQCLETCALFGLEGKNFRFEFEVDPGTVLLVDEIVYSIEKE